MVRRVAACLELRALQRFAPCPALPRIDVRPFFWRSKQTPKQPSLPKIEYLPLPENYLEVQTTNSSAQRDAGIELLKKVCEVGAAISAPRGQSVSKIPEFTSLAHFKKMMMRQTPDADLIPGIYNLNLSADDKLEILLAWALRSPKFILDNIENLRVLQSIKEKVLLQILLKLHGENGVPVGQLSNLVLAKFGEESTLAKNVERNLYDTVKTSIYGCIVNQDFQGRDIEKIFQTVFSQGFSISDQLDLIKAVCIQNPHLDLDEVDLRVTAHLKLSFKMDEPPFQEWAAIIKELKEKQS